MAMRMMTWRRTGAANKKVILAPAKTMKKESTFGPVLPLPLQFLAAWLAVWLGHILQQQVDYYLRAENRALKEKLGGRRLQFDDATRDDIEGI
jgi:hypothetical protein